MLDIPGFGEQLKGRFRSDRLLLLTLAAWSAIVLLSGA